MPPGGRRRGAGVVFAAAALVSLAAVHDQMRHFDPGFHPPGTVAAVLAMLGITLPLAWRRRAPLSVAIAVVVAFLVGRIVVEVAEAAITVLAGSLAIYSAAIHGRRRFRTLVARALPGRHPGRGGP